MTSEATMVALGLATVGGIVWAVRVEGTVRRHDDKFEALTKQFETTVHGLRNEVQMHNTNMMTEMHYIRERIDAWSPRR